MSVHFSVFIRFNTLSRMYSLGWLGWYSGFISSKDHLLQCPSWVRFLKNQCNLKNVLSM